MHTHRDTHTHRNYVEVMNVIHLDSLIVVSFHNVYINQNIKLYTLNIYTTFIYQRYLNKVVLRLHLGTPLVVQGLRLCASNAGGPGSIPGQGTRSRIPQ